MYKTLGLLALAMTCGSVGAAAKESSRETYIPYVSSNGIVEWEVAGDDALYIRAITGGWYLVRTMNACPRLKTAVALGFVTRGVDELDRHGAIVAEGQRCPVISVIRVDGLPSELQRKKDRRG